MCCRCWEAVPVTLFSVAKKNIQGNFKNYLIYFSSMIFSVVIYYTFVSVQYSEEIAKGLQSEQSLKSIFTQASIILILFTAVFIWVSNSFFTRRRKKEVGLYALLGLRKRTIARMMFYENLILGAAALIVGIILGTLLSKLFTMILLKLLDSAADVQFGISLRAIGIVAIVFAVMILFTSVQGYRLIYRFQLVELFQAENEGEQAPKVSAIAAILSAALLAFSYWLAFQPVSTNGQMARNFALLIGSIIAGTYLLFHSAIVYLLKLAVQNKKRYYRGMNMVGTAQLLYRIKSNTRVLTMIALLSALTLCASSVGYSSFYTQKQSAGKEAPFSYMHISQSESFDSRVKEIISSDKEHTLKGEIDIPVLQTEGDFSNLIYQPSGYDAEKVPLKLISASVYNKASSILNRRELCKFVRQRDSCYQTDVYELYA